MDRLYRGHCRHVSVWALATEGAASVSSMTAGCPVCGTIVLRSAEPPPEEVLDGTT